MICTPDRQAMLSLIDEAHCAGARTVKACAELGIAHRTDQRWQRQADGGTDARTTRVHARPAHALTPEEEAAMIAQCNSPEYASLPPAQIVAREADQGRYIAAESSDYRVLARHAQHTPRGRAPSQRVAKPTTYEASGPNQVWSADITYLPTRVVGRCWPSATRHKPRPRRVTHDAGAPRHVTGHRSDRCT